MQFKFKLHSGSSMYCIKIDILTTKRLTCILLSLNTNLRICQGQDFYIFQGDKYLNKNPFHLHLSFTCMPGTSFECKVLPNSNN